MFIRDPQKHTDMGATSSLFLAFLEPQIYDFCVTQNIALPMSNKSHLRFIKIWMYLHTI
jgi:hypothetical protein